MTEHNVWVFGFRYRLRDGAYDRSEEYDPKGLYRYAEPVEYANGSTLGDVWITDEYGVRHPGYIVSPVPMCIESVFRPEKLPGHLVLEDE